MKGNYTRDELRPLDRYGEHHPQMKGNYTIRELCIDRLVENTIPK